MKTRNLCRYGIPTALIVLLSGMGTVTTRADDPNDPPSITQHPVSQTVCDGDNATFTVVATGQELSYQWRRNDEPIDGAVSDTLNLDAVTAGDNGDYDVVVSNPYGSATSNAATLIVDAGPEIVEHPESQQVCEGASVTLDVTVANQVTTYEDAIGSTASSGSGARMRGNYYRVDTGTTLTRIEHYLDITQSGAIVFFVYEADQESGPYTLIAEDTLAESGTGTGYYSSGALAVPLAAGRYYIIGAAWPDTHTYYWNSAHQATSFGASLSGFAYSYVDPLPDPPPTPSNGFAYMQRLTSSDLALTYQWRKDDEALPGGAGPQYTIAAMSSDDAGDYDVVLTNACGSAVSETATLTLGLGVTITQDPNDQSVCVGGAAAFAVTAEGPDLSYQWRLGGEDIAAATAATYAIDAAALEDAGPYDVVVTNPCASVTSAAATLTVADAGPTIDEQPVDQAGCEGEPVSLSVVAAGTGLEYQWRRDGESIADAEGDTYTISNPMLEDAGTYDVVVSNPCGSVSSEPVTLSVDAAASIAEQPLGELLCEDDEHALTIVATGTNLNYQWRKDGEDIDGATTDTYVIEVATLDDTGSYDVIISNNCGSVASAIADVTVVSGPVIAEQPAGQRLNLGDPLTLSVTLDLAGFPTSRETIGAPDSSSSGPRLRGNSYAVSETTTLTRIEHYLDISTSGPLVFFVYEADDEQGPYTLILEDNVADSGTGIGFYASSLIEVPLEAGRYYLIGAAWPGAHTYHWGGTHPQETAFGQSVHGYAASYQSPLPYDPVPGSSNVYCQRLTTTDTVASFQWRRNGVEIIGATDETFEIAAVAPADSGSYTVEVSNICGTMLSAPAPVMVLSPFGSWLPDPAEPDQSEAEAEQKDPEPQPYSR